MSKRIFALAFVSCALCMVSPAPAAAPAAAPGAAPAKAATSMGVELSSGFMDDLALATTGSAQWQHTGRAEVPGVMDVTMGYGIEYAAVTARFSANAYQSNADAVQVNGRTVNAFRGSLDGDGAAKLYDAMGAVPTVIAPSTTNSATRTSPKGRITCHRHTPNGGATTTWCAITGVIGFHSG